MPPLDDPDPGQTGTEENPNQESAKPAAETAPEAAPTDGSALTEDQSKQVPVNETNATGTTEQKTEEAQTSE